LASARPDNRPADVVGQTLAHGVEAEVVTARPIAAEAVARAGPVAVVVVVVAVIGGVIAPHLAGLLDRFRLRELPGLLGLSGLLGLAGLLGLVRLAERSRLPERGRLAERGGLPERRRLPERGRLRGRGRLLGPLLARPVHDVEHLARGVHLIAAAALRTGGNPNLIIHKPIMP
jgi:MFS family permease